METGETIVPEVRVYVLVLNTFGAAEDREIVAVSDDYDRLVNWYNDQFAEEGYREDGWYKTFKKGSLIEYNNPCATTVLNQTRPFGHGIHDEWVHLDVIDRIRERYHWV